MTPDELQTLLIVQERDKRIAAARNELHSAPRQKELINRKLSQFKRKATEAKQCVIDIEKRIHDVEYEADAKRKAIAKMKIQQSETRKNDEYQRYHAEIAKAEAFVDQLETQALEDMETLETARQQVNQAVASYQKAQQEVQENLSRLECQLARIKQNLDQLLAERNQLISQVAPNSRETYERMIQGKGFPAIVPMNDQGRCSGCNMELTHATRLKVMAGKEVAHCENCGRFLY